MHKYTMSDVRASNKAKGYHWFKRFNMELFETEIVSSLYKSKCFISSDTYTFSTGKHERMFSVRHWDIYTGQVRTVGEPHSIKTIEEARKIAKAYIR